MLNWLMRDGALSVSISPKGTLLVEITSLEAIRKSLGTLWAAIQEAKSTGSYNKSKELFEVWGVYNDTHKLWRAGIVKAVEALKLPKESVFLNPQFEIAKSAETGEITQVTLRYLTGKQTLNVFIEKQAELSKTFAGFKAVCTGALQR
jgi:hypothetical protein